MKDYSIYEIKNYPYWGIFIHENQSYLGRCVVWCKRKDVLDLADATSEEQLELFVILKELRSASTKAFAPDWFNYAFLGNETRHLHGHFIPRYKEAKEFEGIIFTDERWGHNYKTDYEFVTPEPVLQKIKKAIQENL
ncbi:hypothetical protein CL644_00935 [bacterium]|nr:hypothetical protein [Parcubacteria group bacterium]MBF05257.1 hypothetical protein [bacterium]|tara:strand:- start:850 stop:1260 length:411 start_codon:yes stop_codon:yes gene_type:complete